MSINLVARSSNILNPCQLSDNDRVQAFVNSDQQQYVNGSQMTFTVPSKEILDMSESYVDFDITAINPIVETPEVYQVLNFPVGGADPIRFNIYFDGVASSILISTSTPTNVATALNNMSSIQGRGYKINVQGTTVAAGDIVIRIVNFDIAGGPPSQVAGPLVAVNSSVQNGAEYGTVALNLQTPGALSTPRLERFLPLFDYIYVQINNETVYNLQDAQILEAMLDQLDAELYRERGYYDSAQYESGLGFYRSSYDQSVGGSTTARNTLISRRLAYKLSNIELFKKILPLNLLENPQFKIYLHIDNANRALICSAANNSANQAIQLTNPKLHYHKLKLVESEQNRLMAMKNSPEGLVIPFRNWHNFIGQIQQGVNNINLLFNPSQTGFLGLYFVMWNTLAASNATNSRKLTTFLKNNIGSFRLKIGSDYFPLDAVRSDTIGESYSQILANLVDFTEIVKLKRVGGDLFAMPVYSVIHTADPSIGNNASGPYRGQGMDQNDYYLDEFGYPRKQTSVMAISTSDMGYDEQSQLCVRTSMNGVDTAALPNVQLELYELTVDAPMQCDIFYLSQDYLIFRNGEFIWKH